MKHYMRDNKGNLQLVPDEDELQKPKKPLTPYMLFVREVSITIIIFSTDFDQIFCKYRQGRKWWQHIPISLPWMS